MFRGFPNFKDPRAALFGLTLFSHSNPGLEKQLEVFANILEATRSSLSAIRSEMHNYETSMLSATAPGFSTQPVSEPVEEEINPSYTNPNYNPPQSQAYPTVETMNAKDDSLQAVKEKLDRFMDQNPERLNSFLDDLERLIRKYR